jgi:exopolysaccharide production protein ExoZ
MQSHHTPLNTRIHSLDYLRGLAALGIMLYHYSMWTFNKKFDAGDLIQRIGIFGVPIFYILSGLTLHVIYHNRLQDFGAIKSLFL